MDAFVFDIDGTLLESFEADCDLYIAAVRKVLGVTAIDTNWSAYRHVTDQGILREIMQCNGIVPSAELMDATRREFVASLRAHIEIYGPFREIPGARDFVSRLVAEGRQFVAYATGAWRESAMLKLKSAAFPIDGLNVSTSSECDDRVSIMRGAVAGAPRELGRIIYFGDGVWDRAAAETLGWEFVPVGAALDGLRHFDDIAAWVQERIHHSEQQHERD